MASIQSTRGRSLSRMHLTAASELAGTRIRRPSNSIMDCFRGGPQQYEIVSKAGTGFPMSEMSFKLHLTMLRPGATSRTRISPCDKGRASYGDRDLEVAFLDTVAPIVTLV